MIDVLDLLHRCSPVFAVLWLAAYFHHRMERMARAQRLACERLADEIRRIDPRAAERLQEDAPPPVAPVEPRVELPTARVIQS